MVYLVVISAREYKQNDISCIVGLFPVHFVALSVEKVRVISDSRILRDIVIKSSEGSDYLPKCSDNV